MQDAPRQGLAKNSKSGWAVRWPLIFCCALALSLATQWQNGAFRSDLGGDPDEAAHAVTSLMVRDYVAQGLGRNPMAFANRYYERFPKVALGHYPPGYYVLAAVPLQFWRDVRCLAVFQSALAAALATLACACGWNWVGRVPSLVVGALLLALPVIQNTTACIMADPLVAVLCLLAAWAWGGYLQTPSAWRSLGFGILATAAILTKGSAISLAGLPVVALMLSGKLPLMRRASLWLATVPVVLFAFPWMIYSVRFTEEGMVAKGVVEFFAEASRYYAASVPETLGIAVAAMLVLGFLRLLIRVAKRHWLDAKEASLWGLLLSTVPVLLFIPAGTSPRYLIPVAAPALLLAMNEGRWFVGWLVEQRREGDAVGRLGAAAAVMALAIGGATWVECVRWCPKNVSGYSAAITEVTSRWQPATGEEHVLVSSDARGEGAVVAAAAFADGGAWPTNAGVLRGSKELATSDWLGRGYKTTFGTNAELLDRLRKRHVSWVLADESVPAERVPAHHPQLLRALGEAAEEWQPSGSVHVSRGRGIEGELKIFRRMSESTTASHANGG